MPTGVAKIVVTIHGIGDQYRNATVQSVVNIFSRCFKEAVAVPLGGFYAPDGKIEAFHLRSPPGENGQSEDIGFVEVYWADIPRRVQHRGYTIEETKAWARTVVQRVQARYSDDLVHDTRKQDKPLQAWARTVVQRVRARYSKDVVDHTRGQDKPLLRPRDYLSATATIEEMIDAIRVMGNLLFLAEKAGLYKFDLDDLLTSFVGDVQIVAEFANYRERILRQFRQILSEVHKRNPDAAIYIVAHSEGTVVALLALLQAFSTPPQGTKSPERSWVRNVRGLMTIGSPIDKHIALWPDMWDPVQNPNKTWTPSKDDQRIAWRNYYDYADPVGFELDTARAWLTRHGWHPKFFQFEPDHDFGFSRYFLPAKAHNDYWNDPAVFGHFIRDVMNLEPFVDGKPMKKPAPPPDRRFAKVSSYITPFILIVALLSSGVYLLFLALNSYLSIAESRFLVIRDVAGLTCLLSGATACSRILCLTRRLAYKLIAILAFLVGAAGYIVLRTPVLTKAKDPFLASATTVVIALLLAVFAVVISVAADRCKQCLQQYPPIRLFVRGARPLLIAGGLAAALLMINRAVGAYHHHFPQTQHSTPTPFWPVVLSTAAFLYLWWLAIILFDLTFVWQRYIRKAVWQKYLFHARQHLISRRERESDRTISAHARQP